MRTKSNLLFLATIIVSISLFTSCNDNDGDTTPPVINLITPAEGAVLTIGSPVELEMEVSDNEGLKSYKINIHNAFDGHDHDKSLKSQEETIAFSYDKVWNDIGGLKEAKIQHAEIFITANATPGKYHLIVYCTDASKNESYIARNVVLSNGDAEEEHAHEH
ncbi:MAG: DUF4625 domain-containing protein [Bacteroidales bacterium]|nr:DUF4625 domain-containing protein [Bacteroidales bacterium]